MAAIPAAPAAAQSEAFCTVIPPIAITGIETLRAGFRELLCSLRRPECHLRRRFIDWPENHVTGASLFRRTCTIPANARYADQEIGVPVFFPCTNRFASSTGMLRSPKCTPRAPAAATSSRSFTRIRQERRNSPDCFLTRALILAQAVPFRESGSSRLPPLPRFPFFQRSARGSVPVATPAKAFRSVT